MKHSYLKFGFAISASVILAGCVDDNYDLSDIDTTTRIPVNNLVIPINLSDIVLDDVIDLADNDNISEVVIDGKKAYAIEKGGEISTDDITVDPMHINAPSIESKHINLSATVPLGSKKHAPSLDDLKINYTIDSEMLSGFGFKTDNIDPAVVAVKNVKSSGQISLQIRFTLPQWLANDVGKVTFKDVALKLPKGLLMADGTPARFEHGTYNPATGTAIVNDDILTNGSREILIGIKAEQLDLQMAGVNIVDHAIDYSGETGLAGSGTIALTPRLENITLPTEFTLNGDFDLSSFSVKSVSGTIDYQAEGIDIEPIDLSDLPDFLADSQTNILLANPQVYLGAVNTTAPYHTGVSGQVELESIFGYGNDAPVRTENSPSFSIGYDRGATMYNIVLAPDTDNLNLLGEYPNPTKYQFGALSTILSNPANGEGGLPKKIHVSLPSLRFYGDAVDFPIGQGDGTSFGKIDGITGSYKFFAPLALKDNSMIVYSKTEEDISTEDVDKVTINKVHLSAIAFTDVPFKVELSVALFNKAGKQIGVPTEKMVILPGQSTPVQLGISSTPDSPIKDIYSVQYRAHVLADGDERPLSPNQIVKLSNIRITLDGYYDTDF